MKIKVLDQETVLKIAAGEVIERPASVVKELMENAVDAGAVNVGIEVFSRDEDRIVVWDDGTGLSPEDLALAVERHATSKISNGDDLFAVGTMGFRGEALASIGAVSEMTITSRTKNAVEGSTLVVRGGDKGKVQPASSPVGTRVTVENLFYNTPARKKFLRTRGTEFSAISEVVQQHILAWPEIRFKLQHNGRAILSSPGTGSSVDAIASVAGTEIAENLLECNGEVEGCSVRGYIASPNIHRGNRAMQYFTVNRRPVSVRLMGSALDKAYHTLLPVNRYPIAFLNLEIAKAEVDVNVHPAKREVKFTDSSIVYKLLYNACLQTLAEVTSAKVTSSEYVPEPIPWKSGTDGAVGKSPGSYNVPVQPRESVREVSQLRMEAVTQAQRSDYTILGQVFSSFLVVATAAELRLVDQHAAEERVLYEKYRNILKAGQRPGQAVIPIEMPLSGRLRQFLELHLPRLVELGFKIELNDAGMIVREVPILFKKVLSDRDLIEILEQIQEREGISYDLSDYNQAALMLLACKGAVKANHRLSNAEASQLLADLDKCENSRTCPHGRPIWVAFDRVNLEKMFARR